MNSDVQTPAVGGSETDSAADAATGIELLRRHVPLLRFDRQYDYRLAAVEGIVENPGNLLRTADGEVIARVGGEPALTLDLLSAYPDDREPSSDDCLCQAPDVLGDARRMEVEPALRRPALRPPRARGRTRLAPVLALALLQPQEPVRVRQARGRLGDGPDRARHGRAAGATRLRPTRLRRGAQGRRRRVGRARRRAAPGRLRRAALPRLLLRGRHPSRIRSASTTRTETGPRPGCRSSGSAIG